MDKDQIEAAANKEWEALVAKAKANTKTAIAVCLVIGFLLGAAATHYFPF